MSGAVVCIVYSVMAGWTVGVYPERRRIRGRMSNGVAKDTKARLRGLAIRRDVSDKTCGDS